VNADLVVCADTVHTFCDTGSDTARPMQAIAIADGVIAATGTRRDVRDWTGPRTEVLDLGRATVTPGLTDGHMHPVMGFS
jgi:predicted amidohydrolase YtcJ